MRKALIFVLAVLCLLPAMAAAQTVTGQISGRVADASGAVMPDVKIVARNQETQLVREAITNAEGYFLFSFMTLGTYEVTATSQGFQTVRKRDVVVELNRNTVSDFKLDPSGVVTTVDVTGEMPIVEATQGEVKHGLEYKQVEATPLPGRNFLSLVEQIPGFQNAPWIGSSNNPTNSTGSYASFNGMGSRSTTFQIDGVNNDDSSENQNRQNVNPSTIREFQVLTNAYSAQHGRAGGAVILVQTKSGANQFHGDAYTYIQNDVFNANAFFNNRSNIPKGKIRRNNYGGTVGGPVWRDKLFFFLSGDRVRNKTSSTYQRFIWLPEDGPRACNAGETPKPGGPYCVEPATHPNLQRDLQYMRNIMDLWRTDELSGVAPNDPIACAELIASGRPNRCVRINGVPNTYPDSDYSAKLDWNAPKNTTVSMRYQYSRQIRQSGRIVQGDNYGVNNNRQYNIGLTAVHVFNPSQTGEFRFGFGNRTTLQDVVDGNHIPTIRFGSTLTVGGFLIGTSTNVPINRRQHDKQYVYNHTLVGGKHTLRAGIDQRFLLLDDISGDRSRGYWTFGSLQTLTSVREKAGFTGWENFLRGYATGYQVGFGNALAENRYNETNLYFQDDYRIARTLTLNLGIRWEGVGAPREQEGRFEYGFGGDYNNIQPRFGFAWQPSTDNAFLRKITGAPGDFVVRGGYGIFHDRIFQSVFSQNQLSIRTQPPNGFARDFSGLCRDEISDPTCGFTFTPGVANRRVAVNNANGVRIAGGQLLQTLLIPESNLGMPYTQQWNLAFSRQLKRDMAIEITYNGNRGFGHLFYDGVNQAAFPIVSPIVSVDVGGGNFQPVVFDRVCRNFSDPMCVVYNANGTVNVNSSGTLRVFSPLTSTVFTLAEKGIVVENGVPHGYISLGELRSNERRPDANYIRNVTLRNFGWSYYHGLITKFTKRSARGLTFTGSWTWSKAIDTGSEATYTGIDTNAPTGKGNAARTLRGLSGFDTRHRVVLSYSYELPWFRSQQGVVGRVLGGWQVSGVTIFQSGNPFTVLLGYDYNMDGVGGDRPHVLDQSVLYRSVDNGRNIYPCPTAGIATGVPCPDSLSQLQLPGTAFFPNQTGTLPGDQRPVDPGSDGTGTIGRNTFFAHGMNNFDAAFAKSVQIREGMSLNIRMELYNLFNRVMFAVPSALTVYSSTPMGRITSQRNPSNFVNAARDNGSRMGQISLRLIF